MARAHPELTNRAGDLARSQEFGTWQRTTRVNSRHESHWFVNGLPALLIAAAGLTGLIMFRDQVVGSGAGWGARITFGVMMLFVLVLGVVATVIGLRLRRVGQLWLHEFEQGFVVERLRGGQLCARYDTVDAELIDFVEGGDSTGSDRHYLGLRFTFADSDVLMIVEPTSGAPDVLTEVGERCETTSRTTMSYLEAMKLFRRGIRL